MALLALSTSSLVLPLLGGAALILYVSGRLTIGAMPATFDRSFVRALIACVPITIISAIAVAMGRPALAMHLPIACAVAAMTFGIAAVLSGRSAPPGAGPNRSWAMLVPATAMLLIAALGGRLDSAVLAALSVYGLLALANWARDPSEHAIESDVPEGNSPAAALALWSVGVIATCVAGVLAMYGTDHLDAIRTRSSDALVAVFLLAPAIVVPFFFELLPPCRSIGWGGSISSLLKLATLCICFILPLSAIAITAEPRITPFIKSLARPTTMPATLPATVPVVSAPTWVMPDLPVVATRADLLVLVGVSLLLIPIASGWIRPGKLEALALLACYLMNLLLVMAASV